MSSVEETEGQLHTMCNPKKFIKIVKDLTTKWRECIEDMGFGVLLNINSLVFHLSLCELLLKSITPETKEIVLHGKSIPIRESDFEKVMGLPNGTQDVECDIGEFNETCIMMKNLLIKAGKNVITLSSLMRKLKNMKDVDEVFRISFILFTISTLFCLPASSKIDEALLTQLKDPRLIRHKKWATYCFLYLMDGVRKFRDGGSRIFQGCIPFLQIFYWGCISQKEVYVNGLQVPLVVWSENKAAVLHKLVAKDNFFYSSTVEVDKSYWTVKHQGVEHEVEKFKVKAVSIKQSLKHLSSVQKPLKIPDLVEKAIAPMFERFKVDMLKLITKQCNEVNHVASHEREVVVVCLSTESFSRSPYLTRQKTRRQRTAEKKKVSVCKSKVEIHLKPNSRRMRR